MKLGWPSVEMMLNGMTMAEYVNWIAYFSVDWNNFKPEQSPDEMKNNLVMSLAAAKKKRK